MANATFLDEDALSPETPQESDYLCFGDFIGLYCQDTEGYAFCWQNSSVHNGIFIFQKQGRDKPVGIPNIQAVEFQVRVQNRYKLNKKLRRLACKSPNPKPHEEEAIKQAKRAADAENVDNVSEQKRQRGKRVRYGDIIQLHHKFSQKYIHVSTTEISKRNKNNMLVFLEEHNSKQAQFRIRPRYKVKGEGEYVEIFDQVVFESIKSPNQFFHASDAWKHDNFYLGFTSELNLGIHPAGFTVVKIQRPIPECKHLVKAGSVIQLFHKDLEAYLVAEGLFNDILMEEAHLRVREIDMKNTRTLYPSTSANTYWQVEAESSILYGNEVEWGQQVRLRHMCSRKYLSISEDLDVELIDDGQDPHTVFRLHPGIQDESELKFDCFTRIENVLSGGWINAVNDSVYDKREFPGVKRDSDLDLERVRWDDAILKQVQADQAKMYQDAYTIQEVAEQDVKNFNIVAGFAPILLNFLKNRENGELLNGKRTNLMCKALAQMKDFMLEKDIPVKKKQKLMRNLRIVDLLVRILRNNLKSASDQNNLAQIFRGAYEVLHTYMLGPSKKNSLYFAKYITYFQSHIPITLGNLGLNVVEMLGECIRDNRKIVNRITERQVAMFVNLLKRDKNYRYLDLLNVLCVCNDVAITDNQNSITELWLCGDQGREARYLTTRGQYVNAQPNVIYLSTDGSTWKPLHEIYDKNHANYNAETVRFYDCQLELYSKLVAGRNDHAVYTITKGLNILTWDEAFLCLNSKTLPEHLRAKYCELIIGLFINVGTNYSVVDHPSLSVIYEDVYAGGPNDEGQFIKKLPRMDNWIMQDGIIKDLVTLFPVIRDWINDFFEDNQDMTASQVGHNILIKQVMRLFYYLVKFGYYSSQDFKDMLKPLMLLLNGNRDKPFPPDHPEKGYTKASQKLVDQYRASGRYEQTPENTALVDAKYQIMEVMDILLAYQNNTRYEGFISMFKIAECTEEDDPRKKISKKVKALKEKRKKLLAPLMSKDFDPYSTNKKDIRVQKRVMKEISTMFEMTSYFNADQIYAFLIDLSNYKYDKMLNKALSLLTKVYTSKMLLFRLAVDGLVLLKSDSCQVNGEIARIMPIIKRSSQIKMSSEQADKMVEVLDKFIGFCKIEQREDRHPMNQQIMINHEVLSLMFDILTQDTESTVDGEESVLGRFMAKCLDLLRAMALDNENIQQRMFARLDNLLTIKGVESRLALALKQIFVGNQTTCLKILPNQIKHIIDMVAAQQEKAPELLDLLTTIVKVDKLDLTIKRNQELVIKYFMQDYSQMGYVLEGDRDYRLRLLMATEGTAHLAYLLNLITLLATCAEGENRFVESMCQKILSLRDIITILNHKDIDCNLKKPYIHFLLHVYMNVGFMAASETEASELAHDSEFWDYLSDAAKEMEDIMEWVPKHMQETEKMLTKKPGKTDLIDKESIESAVHIRLFYYMDAVFPLLQTFYSKFYAPRSEDALDNEVEITDQLTRSLTNMCEVLLHLSEDRHYLETIVSVVTAIIPPSNIPNTVMEGLIERAHEQGVKCDEIADHSAGMKEYYKDEIELNNKLNNFAVNCSLVYGCHNTVKAQIGFKSKREYTEVGGDEDLPLGEEFQEHLKRFCKTGEKKVEKKLEMAKKLLDQLCISTKMHKQKVLVSEQHRLEQEQLDMRSLQLLRAIIHNEERKLPEDWEDSLKAHARQLELICKLQLELNRLGAVASVLPHTGSPSEHVTREVLSFLGILMFNANAEVQTSLLKYFQGTREESFFGCVRDKMQTAASALKERRSLAAQQKARRKALAAQKRERMIQTDVSFTQLQRQASLRSSKRSSVKDENDKKKGQKKGKKNKMKSDDKPTNGIVKQKKSDDTHGEKINMIDMSSAHSNGITNIAITIEDEELLEVVEEEEKEKDNTSNDENGNLGNIELVLKLLSRICDGQHNGLQDYMRIQADNLASFNMVAETTSFIGLVYSNVNAENIDLTIHLFDSLNEFAAGNHQNQSVLLGNKIVDFINYILRNSDFTDCEAEKILELHDIIAKVTLTIIEENGPECSITAIDVKDSMDKQVLYKCMGQWYQRAMNEKEDKEIRETSGEVALLFYLILARFIDLDPKLENTTALNLEPHELASFNHYKRMCMSVELIKDDCLQKVTFKVDNPGVIREEVKDMMIWEVDRTSPSNKIRDMITWSKDIINDVSYQRAILKNPITNFITKYWSFWNWITMLLSLTINVLMLVTWNAKATVDDPVNNITGLPDGIEDPMPVPWFEHYYLTMWCLGGTHNFFSLILVLSYFMANHPRLPSLPKFGKQKKKKGPEKAMDQDEDDDEIEEEPSNIQVNLFSFTTFYYLLYLTASGAGTYYQGYFFAFHLLNIITTNQLLKGVIQAVTKNGRSLFWVMILGLIIFYIYSLISFAFLRGSFNPEDNLYCRTLWECTVTMIRYGLIGDLFDYMNPPQHGEDAMFWFGMYVIFNLSFFIFITTIGLNIIFGIIVDTFSELRDLKWQTEQDIRENCFICSRSSYDFEHYANGFDAHVTQEHDMWAYIYFFIHLQDTKSSDYTALELHVAKLMEKNKGDFFPLHRAMSLRSLDEDTTQNKIDELHNDITKLVNNQQKEAQKRKKEFERMKLIQFRDKHRSNMSMSAEEIDTPEPKMQSRKSIFPRRVAVDKIPELETANLSTQTEPETLLAIDAPLPPAPVLQVQPEMLRQTVVIDSATQAVQTDDKDIMNFSCQTEDKEWKNLGIQTEDEQLNLKPSQEVTLLETITASQSGLNAELLARDEAILSKLDVLMKFLEEQPRALEVVIEKEPLSEQSVVDSPQAAITSDKPIVDAEASGTPVKTESISRDSFESDNDMTLTPQEEIPLATAHVPSEHDQTPGKGALQQMSSLPVDSLSEEEVSPAVKTQEPIQHASTTAIDSPSQDEHSTVVTHESIERPESVLAKSPKVPLTASEEQEVIEQSTHPTQQKSIQHAESLPTDSPRVAPMTSKSQEEMEQSTYPGSSSVSLSSGADFDFAPLAKSSPTPSEGDEDFPDHISLTPPLYKEPSGDNVSDSTSYALIDLEESGRVQMQLFNRYKQPK